MIEIAKSKDNKLSVIARVGIKYLPFELDKIGQEWVRQKSEGEKISAVDLVSMVLAGQAKLSNASAHARLLKRIEDEQQTHLPLDFTQSFLSCEETGEENNLYLCLINEGGEFDLKLLCESASNLQPIDTGIQVSELSLSQFKEILDKGNISQGHPTVKRLKHWFAGRMEVWGLAYG